MMMKLEMKMIMMNIIFVGVIMKLRLPMIKIADASSEVGSVVDNHEG